MLFPSLFERYPLWVRSVFPACSHLFGESPAYKKPCFPSSPHIRSLYTVHIPHCFLSRSAFIMAATFPGLPSFSDHGSPILRTGFIKITVVVSQRLLLFSASEISDSSLSSCFINCALSIPVNFPPHDRCPHFRQRPQTYCLSWWNNSSTRSCTNSAVPALSPSVYNICDFVRHMPDRRLPGSHPSAGRSTG